MNGIKLISYFMRAYPWRSAVMVCCLLLSGVSDGVGLMTLLPILDAIASSGGGSQSVVGHAIQQLLSFLGFEPRLPTLLVLMVIVIYIKGCFILLAMRQAGYTVAHVTNGLRIRLIRALMEARWSYFISQPTGYFANAVSSEAMRAATAYNHAVLMIAAIVQVIVYGVVALMISWKITLLSFVIASFLMFMLRGLIQISRDAGERQTMLMKSLITRLTDTLQGIKPIKAMAQEQNIQPFLESDSEELNKAQRRSVFASEASNALQEPLMATMVAVGIYFAIARGGQSFSILLVMVFLFSRLLQRFYSAQRCYQELSAQESALWSLDESINIAELEHEEQSAGNNPPVLNTSITFKHVTFGYGETDILKDICFDIPRGSFVAIVGPSGGGKTTIADLLVGLFLPRSGAVRVDGVPLTSINLRAWRQMIGYVPQEMLLFHETIFHNITLGDPSITRDNAEEALRLADAWDFVSSLPKGIDSSVGERGSKLSGGQRQRLSLARALVRKPVLLILDEVTTALDPQTEIEICTTLRKLSGRVTILTISHQQAMIRFADRVYELTNGRMVLKEKVMTDDNF